MNPHSIDDRQRLMLTSCYTAVREHFSHIAIRDIIDPPHGMFDAMLARQIAITLMRDAFNVPRRRIANILDRQRTTISFNMQTVTGRRACPVFDIAYGRIASRAREIYLRETRKAVA